jgi:hypothetical protein
MLIIKGIINMVPVNPEDKWVGIFRQAEPPYFHTVPVGFWVNCVVGVMSPPGEPPCNHSPAILAAEIVGEGGRYGDIRFFAEAENYVRLEQEDKAKPWLLEAELGKEFKKLHEGEG